MNCYQYLYKVYGLQAANTYLKILETPLNEIQFERDSKEVFRLVQIDEAKYQRHANAQLIEWDGEQLTASEWAKLLGIEVHTFRGRLKRYGYNSPQTFQPCQKRTVLTWQGKTKTYQEWAKELNITANALVSRVKRHGLSEKVFTIENRQNKIYTYNNESLTISGWAKKLGVSYATFYHRLKSWGEHNPKTYTTLLLRK